MFFNFETKRFRRLQFKMCIFLKTFGDIVNELCHLDRIAIGNIKWEDLTEVDTEEEDYSLRVSFLMFQFTIHNI